MGTMIIDAGEKERSYALLDAAYESGINTFDTAHGYAGGQSERALGPWANERGLREKVVILTKGCHPSQDRKRVTPFDLAADLHDSLARLQSDYIDIYMLHRDDPSLPVGPIVEALNEHHAAGRIRTFGGSNWRHERIAEANEYAEKKGLIPFTASSPNYGLAEQVQDPWGPGCVSVSGPQNAAARSWYERTGVALFAYSSLGRGFFAGNVTRGNFKTVVDGASQHAYCHEVNFKRLDRAQQLARARAVSVPQIALAFIFHSRMNVFALVGAASRKECQDNAAALDIKLAPNELEYLDLRGETL